MLPSSCPLHDSYSQLSGGVLLVGDGCTYFIVKQNGKYVRVPAAVAGDPTSSQANIGPDGIPMRSWFMRFLQDFLGNVVRERGFPIPFPDAYIPALLENAKKSGGSAAGGYEWGTIGRKQYYMPIGWDGDEEDAKLGLGKDVGEAIRQTTLVS